jgi:putative restriction endonuclease
MDAPDFLSRLDRLRRHASGGLRAPHKPLLLLYALARWRDGQETLRYRDADAVLPALIRTYGPPGTRARVADPFVRLRSDGIWRLDAGAELMDASDQGRPGALAAANPEAGFTPEVLALLRATPGLADWAARRLLDANFPPSLHNDIAAALGLDLDNAGAVRRDARFREAVLKAYLCECAICQFQLRCGDGLVGLEAAHLHWHAFGGACEVANGLALCVLHHRLFDLGMLTLTLDLHVEVSRSVSGPSAMAGLKDAQGGAIEPCALVLGHAEIVVLDLPQALTTDAGGADLAPGRLCLVAGDEGSIKGGVDCGDDALTEER